METYESIRNSLAQTVIQLMKLSKQMEDQIEAAMANLEYADEQIQRVVKQLYVKGVSSDQAETVPTPSIRTAL